MLDEVGADFAVVDSLAEAAAGVVDVGEDSAVSVLDDESIEKGKAAGEGVEIGFVTGLIVKQFCEM